jgi:single-strand DNA-binding protein
MPDGHHPATPQVPTMDDQFGTHRRKVYVEGRLSTRKWTGQDGTEKTTTEVIIDDMLLLDSRQAEEASRR